MIPRSFSGRLAEPSPQQTERDLASLIHRTVEMAVQARHELGYAAVNIGCDGVRRVTMFDGSSCQASGDVCLATREEGITVCLETPRGSGLVFQRVTFSAPECAPVTGWWIVDADGYMYRVPTSLVTAAPYWPMSADPAIFAREITLMRSGTWAKLMCGAALTINLNGEGGALWYRSGEQDWGQVFSCALGGMLPRWSVVPAATITTGVDEATTTFTAGTLTLQPSGSVSLIGQNFTHYSWWLPVGTEYAVTYYVTADTVDYVEGDPVPIGTATEAAIPEGAWRIGYLVIPYGATGAAFTLTATYNDVKYPAWVNPSAFGDQTPAVLLRDQVAPNAGLRLVTVTLPAADGAVVTGPVRVAYGYPFGTVAELGFHLYPSDAAPWMRSYTWWPPGTPETDCAGRVAGDMALCYRRGLAVEYADGHLCLDGAAIVNADDYVSLPELDYEHGPALDVAANVIATPGQEIVLTGADGDLRAGKRYRVRPAPGTAPTATYVHQASAWDDEPNLWIEEQAYYSVDEWSPATTTFTISGADFSDLSQHPASGVPCVIWKRDDFETLYTESTFTQYGYLGETVAGVTQLLDGDGAPISLPAWPGGSVYLAVIGRRVRFRYGWTFGIQDGVGIVESALSPLVTLEPPSGSDTYSVEVTVPGGPAGTVVRYVYRFAWDYGSVPTGGPWHSVGPWAYLGIEGGENGGIYDRMCRRVKTLTASGLEPGTDPVTFYDEDLSLTPFGTRPPSPLVYLGPLTVESPLPVHLLQPMNL